MMFVWLVVWVEVKWFDNVLVKLGEFDDLCLLIVSFDCIFLVYMYYEVGEFYVFFWWL